MAAVSGGRNLGQASGSINIDLAALHSAAATVRAVSQQINQALAGTSTGARAAQSNIQRVGQAIRQLRGEILGFAATGGILTGIGVRAAAGFQEATIQLEGMVGSGQRATQVMEELRKRAREAGLPFGDMLSVATQLLPTLEGNTKELEKWVPLIRRVAALNSQEGLRGAAFAVREALSSGGTDLVSLAERFNISRVALRTALQETGGDFAAALDQVLTKMGITDETAQKMGRSFNAALRGAGNAAVQLLAAGFTPMLETMTRILQTTADWLTKLRETSPVVATLISGTIGLGTAALAAALVFERIAAAAKVIQAAGGFSALAGLARGAGGLAARAAPVALPIAAGAAVGFGVGNAINAATGQPLQGPGDIWLTLKRTVGLGVIELAKLEQGIARGTGDLRKTFADGVADIAEGAGATGLAGALREAGREIQQAGRDAARGIREEARGVLRFLGVGGEGTGLPPPLPEAGAGRGRGPIGDTSQEVREAAHEWATADAKIVREANEARLEATRDYERQRAQTIAQYNLSNLREEEDFQRGRARAAAELADAIADVRRDAAQREERWQRDLAERIADVRADANERLAEIDERYQRDRERAARDHRDRLLDAAARLDAAAVFEEQRNFSRQSQDAEENHREQRDEIRERLAEREADELKSHERRIQDAREADEERIRELRESLAEQQRIEDEDRAIRKQREADDLATRLAEMDAAHAEQLARIRTQQTAQQDANDEAHRVALTKLGLHNEAYDEAQTEAQDKSLASWRLYWFTWAEIEAEARRKAAEGGGPNPFRPGQSPRGFAEGGPVKRTGLALVHAGEYVLNARQVDMLRAMTGNRSGGNGSGGRSVTIGSVSPTIVLGDIGNHALPDVEAAVRRALIGVLNEVAEGGV